MRADMALRATMLVSVLTVDVSGEAATLTAKNFDKKVNGKKAAFVKFLAPWYAACLSPWDFAQQEH